MPVKNVSNEDILENLQDLMQMTSDGFGRLTGRVDGLEGRFDNLESKFDNLEGKFDSLDSRMERLEHQYRELKAAVDAIAGEQQAQSNDIKEILDRCLAIEQRLPNITESELREMQVKLQQVADWAKQMAVKEHLPPNLK